MTVITYWLSVVGFLVTLSEYVNCIFFIWWWSDHTLMNWSILAPIDYLSLSQHTPYDHDCIYIYIYIYIYIS